MEPATIIALTIQYGIPLAVKLLAKGKEEKEVAVAVTETVLSLSAGDVGEKLINATPEQKNVIVDALYDVVTGTADALGNLLGAFTAVGFGGGKNED